MSVCGPAASLVRPFQNSVHAKSDFVFFGAQKIKIIAHDKKWAGGHGLNGEMSAPEGGVMALGDGLGKGEGGASELGGHRRKCFRSVVSEFDEKLKRTA